MTDPIDLTKWARLNAKGFAFGERAGPLAHLTDAELMDHARDLRRRIVQEHGEEEYQRLVDEWRADMDRRRP